MTFNGSGKSETVRRTVIVSNDLCMAKCREVPIGGIAGVTGEAGVGGIDDEEGEVVDTFLSLST